MTDAIVVAHRGLSLLYPENTLLALQKAIDVGAKAVEFDVQMTADKVPVMFHDVDMKRMTGNNGIVMQTSWPQLQTCKAYYPDRFGLKYHDTPVSSLEEIAGLFQQYPQVTACLEIKLESVKQLGLKTVVDTILTVVEPVIEQTQFLSFGYDVIDYLHSLGIHRTNWVLQHYDAESRCAAENLQPQVLACNIKKLPVMGDIFWPGSWEWMVYQTKDPDCVQQLFASGAHYVETDNVKIIAESLPQYFYQ